MSSQFFNDYISTCRQVGMSGKEIIDGWRDIRKKRYEEKFKEVRKLFCQKFGFDENLTDDEISVKIFLRGVKHFD